jgi:two-component system cell cycle response regulator
VASAPRRRPKSQARTRAGRLPGQRTRRPPTLALRAARALGALGAFLDSLAEAAELSPLAASMVLRRAAVRALGWRARLVPSPSTLSTDAHATIQDGVALVPVAPGAGALRLAGGSTQALRRVAALCAQALARARSHPLEPGRRAAHRGRPRVLLLGEDPQRRATLARLLEPANLIIHAPDADTAVELARAGQLDAALLAPSSGAAALRALERLREELESADLPSIAMASADDETTRLRVLELGADFLASPCSASELRGRLDRAIRLGQATRALRDEALTDALTGLSNRRGLEIRLHEEVRRARRYRTPLSCVMADLDGLKAINDELGHGAGDQALQAMAAVLRADLRDTDFAARAGGDEFLVILPHTDAHEAEVLAERIRVHLRSIRVGPAQGQRGVGASFGVSKLGPAGNGEAMVAAADRALYAAKRAGRAAVRRAATRSRHRRAL